MKKILNTPLLAILCIALTFTACFKHEIVLPAAANEYPSLRVVNDLSHHLGSYRTIIDVSLVGYDFSDVSIPSSLDYSAQTFALDKGMPDGYEDIKVTVLKGQTRSSVETSASIIVDFKIGEVTTIRLKQSDDGTFYLD